MGVTPTSIEEVANTDSTKETPQYKVTYSNGESDTYDTVLTAIGRRADTAGLGLDTLGLNINPNNGKIIATNEQTNIPHIYAIGDVVDKTPELTPVAIMAGKMLARRLVDSNTSTNAKTPVEYMNYKDVATAVFTPLELGTVGLSEDEAKAMYV